MNDALYESIWRQFGAAIDTLDNAIAACPDDLWGDRERRFEVWYATYHTIFWLDLYLHGSFDGFAPPSPFNLDELDPAGILPDHVYTRDELRQYIAYCRDRCHRIFESMDEQVAERPCKFAWGESSYLELQLYNMRHVQHHAAQINLILREETNSAPRWVARVRS